MTEGVTGNNAVGCNIRYINRVLSFDRYVGLCVIIPTLLLIGIGVQAKRSPWTLLD